MENSLLKIADNSFNAINNMFTTNTPTTIVVGTIGTTVAIIDFRLLVIVLGCLMIIDFITGIMASYKEYMDKNNVKWRTLKEYAKNWGKIVESSKLRKSGAKFLMYAITILVAYLFENLLFIKGFKIEAISSADFTLSIIVVLFWWLVEIHSIVFENFRRMGFSIIKKIKDIKNDVDEVKENIKL